MKRETPCDYGPCPYADDCDYVDCEYWCPSIEPQDDPDIWNEEPPDPADMPCCPDDIYAYDIHDEYNRVSELFEQKENTHEIRTNTR